MFSEQAKDQYQSSIAASGHLRDSFFALTDQDSFDLATHNQTVRDEQHRRRSDRNKSCKEAIAALTAEGPDALTDPVDRRVAAKKGTGQWLAALPLNSKGFTLSPDEFRVGFALRYNKTPPHMPSHCDGAGCTSEFTLQHAMSCKKGGLVARRHNTIRDLLISWCKKLWPDSSVRSEPRIHPYGSIEAGTDQTRGDLSVYGLWENQTLGIVDVEVTHTECKSYLTRSPDSVLRSLETAKKTKYKKVLELQRKHFTPFVCSSDGVLADEATALVNHISRRLAQKWERPYSVVVTEFRRSISFALVRAAFNCTFNARSDPARDAVTFEDGAALH